METFPDAELPILPVERPEFAADPTPYVEAARRRVDVEPSRLRTPRSGRDDRFGGDQHRLPRRRAA